LGRQLKFRPGRFWIGCRVAYVFPRLAKGVLFDY